MMLTTDHRHDSDDDRYSEVLAGVQRHFAVTVAESPQLFQTDAPALWDTYLDNAPPGTRQFRNCNACRSFINRFGGLVTISATGEIASAVWPRTAPPQYAAAIRAMRRIVECSNVTGVFRSEDPAWGIARTGVWTHFAVVPPPAIRWSHPLTTAGQEMAAKTEDFKMLRRALEDFSIADVRQAHALLSAEALYRSEKVLGVARWLLELHEVLVDKRGRGAHMRAQANLVWRAVAAAPPGYAHVRSGMIGTLLEDIAAGLPFEDVKRKFAEKMNPTQYLRPQAGPSAGNAVQADAIVRRLESAGALGRRFARLADVQALWLPTPAPKQRPVSGVFGHLVSPARAVAMTTGAPAKIMTWAKFRATVLPTAEEIEFSVPYHRLPYTAMVTAKDPRAPNLLQWDNPVSHYVYVNGSSPNQWNLRGGAYHRVSAVVLRPWMWTDETKFAHHGEGVLFALEGAFDTAHAHSGGMFPEQMRAEYHGVRRTLEAHFRNAVIEGKGEAEVCGISLVKGSTWNLDFRVTSRGVRTDYKLDRWD